MRVRVVRMFGATVLSVLFFIAPPNFSQVSKSLQESSTLRVAIDLVLLDVTVHDKRGRPVTTLDQKDFKVYEDKLEQPISYFSQEESPVTWGLVLDRSGSMAGMIKEVYEAALHVIDGGTNEDEVFIMTFSDRPEMVSELTSDPRTLQNSIFGLSAHGSTALYDAVDSALDHIKRGRHRKKALVVITDGADNRSRLTFGRVMNRVKESDVLIYNVGMNVAAGEFAKGRAERGRLEQLAEITGGYAYFPTDIKKCREAMANIAREISEHYTIGYYPTNRSHDGRWRKSRVVVADSNQRNTQYFARSRTGYYAPASEK